MRRPLAPPRPPCYLRCPEHGRQVCQGVEGHTRQPRRVLRRLHREGDSSASPRLLTAPLQSDLLRRIEETANAKPAPRTAIVPVYSRQSTIAGLQCHVVGNSDAPSLAVIIAHGYGANYDDFVDVGSQLLGPLSRESIGAVFIFPNGFLPLPGGGGAQRSWWPIDFQALFGEVLSGRLHFHTPPGLDEARKRMVGLIDALKAQYSLPTKRIVIGGFSQGAMLTTDVALHLPEPPAALLVLSGTYVAEPVWKPLVANRKGLKVLQQHGTNDQVHHSLIKGECVTALSVAQTCLHRHFALMPLRDQDCPTCFAYIHAPVLHANTTHRPAVAVSPLNLATARSCPTATRSS